MDHVHAASRNYRIQDWRQDQDSRSGFHQAANNQKQEVHQQHHDNPVVRNSKQSLCNSLRNLFDGKHAAQNRSGTNDDKNGRRGVCGFCKFDIDLFQVKFFVNKQSYQESVEYRDNRSFRWCKETAVDTSEDDNRNQQRPDCFLKSLPNSLAGELQTVAVVTVFLAVTNGNHDQGEAADNAWQEARHEHGTDGSSCGYAVHNHWDAWRNDCSQTSGSRYQSHGPSLLITHFDHSRNHDGTDGSYRCRSRAGNRAEEQARNDGYYRKSAGKVTYQCVKETYQSLGKSAAFHQRAAEYEERNCHKRERVTRCKHTRCQIVKVDGSYNCRIADNRKPQGNTDWNAEEYKYKEYSEYQ